MLFLKDAPVAPCSQYVCVYVMVRPRGTYAAHDGRSKPVPRAMGSKYYSPRGQQIPPPGDMYHPGGTYILNRCILSNRCTEWTNKKAGKYERFFLLKTVSDLTGQMGRKKFCENQMYILILAKCKSGQEFYGQAPCLYLTSMWQCPPPPPSRIYVIEADGAAGKIGLVKTPRILISHRLPTKEGHQG